ncbi:glycoside hydrolase family 15 protein [Actinomadura mexicana]|uniref:Glycosyl hydrolases family 15 n=1 Tax=Actinomadura mexicana TaxID=134959 RepID=A0A238WXI8_9ACTN|nr:glycoside hydrolase family 15 protein [Actinomadura mexicana]SNR51226.1 Glycosyl hydrolases family 15 [Actinomadura mexicana]
MNQSPSQRRGPWRSPPIRDLAVLANGLGEGALVDRRSNVIAWGLPDANDVPVITALYDPSWKTGLRLALEDKEFPTNRRYEDLSHTLVSTWATQTGTAREQALMVGSPGSSNFGQMVRLLTCERGSVTARLDLNLCHGYRGEQPLVWIIRQLRPGYTVAEAEVGGRKLVLATNMALEFDDGMTSLTGRLTLEAGKKAWIWLGWRDNHVPMSDKDIEHLVMESDDGWATWVQTLDKIPDNDTASDMTRWAILLRGLGHRAGTFFAAFGRSLPEDVPNWLRRAIRVWDYLYHWMRDGGLTVSTLDDLGDREVLPAVLEWYRSNPSVFLGTKIMYGPNGEDVAQQGEHIVPELGYRGSLFRYGNGAGNQKQHDRWVYPLDHLWRGTQRGMLDRGLEDLVLCLAEQAAQARFKPCSGVWEVRRQDGEAFVVYASAQLLNAQALIFAAKIFESLGLKFMAHKYREMANEVKAWVLENCVHNGVIVAAPGLNVLDSSILLAFIMGQDVFNLDDPSDRQLVEATLRAIDAPSDDPSNPIQGLRVGRGYVRYHTASFGDGITSDEEGTFNNVTGWVAQVFLRLGKLERADAVMADLLLGQNDLGMWSEELMGNLHLGNPDQAYVYITALAYGLERAAFVAAQDDRFEGMAA